MLSDNLAVDRKVVTDGDIEDYWCRLVNEVLQEEILERLEELRAGN